MKEGWRIIFVDWMRYGLISQRWRNWGPVGERVAVPRQMEFEWGYLWVEADVAEGEINFWVAGGMDGEMVKALCARMTQRWGEKVGLVWDNAPVHKAAVGSLPEGIRPIFLPAYSPELDPVERLFEEVRREGANKVFSSLAEGEEVLVNALKRWGEDREKVRQLMGYSWILEQVQPKLIIN